MKEKMMSLDQAASLVQDGSLLGMTMAVMENAPMAFLRELVRKRLQRLRLSTLPGGGLNADFLIGAGMVAEYETSYCFLGAFGPAPNFQRALRNQTIKMLDNTWGAMFSMVQAGSMGVPFVALRGLIGSDLLKHRPDIPVINSPFNPGEQVAVARPIRPDVSIFHALQADPWGNAVTPGLREDLMLARASRRVIVTAEEIVPGPLSLQDAPENTFLPAIDVDVVAYAPRGAHPCACGELYPCDHGHITEYLEAAKDEKAFQQYLDRFVRGPATHEEYLKRLKINP